MSPGLNLWSVFSAVSRSVPDRVAVQHGGRVTEYRELSDRALRLASVLRSAGLDPWAERGDLRQWETGQPLVGLHLLNSSTYVEAMLGAFAARNAPFNLNYRYVPDELSYVLDDADAAALVYHERFAPVVAAAVDRVHRRPFLLQVADGSGHGLVRGALDYEGALAGAAPFRAAGHSSDDLYVLYTGGTTGMPKGTLWCQGDLWMAALGGDRIPNGDESALADRAASGYQPTVAPAAPLMHGAAQWMALTAILTGGTVYFGDVTDRLDPFDLWSTIAANQVQATLLIGEAMVRPALDALEGSGIDLSCLRKVFLGGALTSSESKVRMLGLLPGVTIIDVAGASETGGALRSVSRNGHPAAAGVFDPGPGAGVLDATRRRRLAPSERDIGWYATRGHVPLGYLGDRAKTLSTFVAVDGQRWAVPGDRAQWLPDGTIRLLGREANTINTGGEKVFAEEVEQALVVHPEVADALVVGRASQRWGEEVVAVVQLRDGSLSTDDQLTKHLSVKLARYKLPKAFVHVPEVRRTPAGKADYAWARQVASGDLPPSPSF